LKFTAVLAAAGALALATAAFAQPPAPAPEAPAAAAGPSVAKGQEVFAGRCKMCHGDGGGAPPMEFLSSLKPDAIFDALKTGPMQPMASGLSDDDMKSVAAFLTAPKPAA
jgi:mono/diheme cytochrome c family protein